MKNILFSNLTALYGVRSPGRLVGIYRAAGGPFSYLGRFWTTQDFALYPVDSSKRYRAVRLLLLVGMMFQLAVGISLLYAGAVYHTTGSGYVGAALILSYPIVWAQVVFLLALAWQLLHPKQYGKAVLCAVLEHQVRQLRERNDFTMIAVAGSVGKTSTKLAIAQLLARSKRVRYQEGNYNDRLTVPLVLFNVTEPNIYNVGAWLKIYFRNRRKLEQPYPYDIVVVELGTDGPGQMKNFAYLHPDLTVVTSIADEHMEYFKTIDAVAAEELTVFDYSSQVLLNRDDVASKYLEKLSYDSYGLSPSDGYHIKLAGKPSQDGQKITIDLKGETITLQSHYYGEQGAKVLLAAAAIAHMIGVPSAAIKPGLAELAPFSGRLQILKGAHETVLLDDTYNASPLAVRAALDVLAAMEAPQHIAILGSMNELGATSASAHTEIGTYCDPKKLDLVVTIGTEAKKYLALAAKENGCVVKSFTTPKKAGEFVKGEMKKRAAVLAKGSQNGVFAEEALKPLLQNPDDAARLVRQSDYWMRIKRAQFGD